MLSPKNARVRIPLLNPQSRHRVTSGSDERGITAPPATQDRMPEFAPWKPRKRTILM